MAKGSVAEVTALLASWCERASEGLAAVEFDSELARRRVVEGLRSRLNETTFSEVTVPNTGSPFELVNELIAELGSLPPGVVSITGFETIFPLGASHDETLAAFNFQRERLAEPPLRQIWWLSSRVADGFLRQAPDLYSWFIVRLHLTETIFSPAELQGSMEPRTFQGLEGTMPVPLEDARQRAADLAKRFERALGDPKKPIGELTRQLMEPAVRALREAGAEREARELESDLRRRARAKGRPVAPAVFVSYNSADRAWAEWIAWHLEAADYDVVIQDWDFRPGSNFVLEMQRATAETDCTLAVLSPSYLDASYTHPEWAAAFARDPEGKERRLVPVRVEPCELTGLLAQIVYIDLVGLDEAAAREYLLTRLALGRARPLKPPPFPGRVRPKFPGLHPLSDAEVTAERLAALPPDEIPEPGALPPGSRMPLSRNPLFVGREDDLRTLARHLKAGETAAVGQVETTAATGLGGVGKTQLACEFVHRYGRYFAGGVFWLSFADPEAVPAEVAACGRRLADPEFDEWTLEQQMHWVEHAWQEPLVRLLVFDNCEEPALLERWRPPTGGCRVLVTSRRASWDPAFGVKSVALGTLPRAESVALLRSFRPDLTVDPVLDEIADELGDLPLALHLAGSFLACYQHAPAGQPGAYLEQLRKGDLLDHPSLQGRGSDVSPTGHDRHVARTFALSYERLDASDPVDGLARLLLARAAFFAAGEPIPRSLLLATAGIGKGVEEDLLGEDALKRLIELGLLEEEPGGAVKVHRLVAAFARWMGNEEEARAAVAKGVLEEASRLIKAGFPAPLLGWQVHLRAVTDAALLHRDAMAAHLCNELGYHLQTIGDLKGARPYFERALELNEETLGAEHPDTARSLSNLGFLLRGEGDLVGARPYYDHALAINEKVLGPEHPNTASTLNNLGVLLVDAGDLEGARPYFERALITREKVLGAEHPDTAQSLNNLGSLLEKQGDLAGAQPYFMRAVEIRETVLGEHLDTAWSLNNLGGLLQELGDLEGARPYLKRALAICEAVLGTNRPATARSLNNIGFLLYSQGDLAGAWPYFERALAIYEEVLGAEHPDTARTLNNLGFLLEKQGDLTGARRYFERACAILEDRLGPDHPDTRSIREKLESLDEG